MSTAAPIALARYTYDLTEQAAHAVATTGRNTEVRWVLELLNRRAKRFPLLVGLPGVGKTAVVIGLAQRIISGAVPAGWSDAKILAIRYDSLLADMRYPGELESRMLDILSDIATIGRRSVLYFEDLHLLPKAALAILKVPLQRELYCIGETTNTEYAQHFSRGSILGHMHQRVAIEEAATVEDTLAVLRAHRNGYERHYRIEIPDRLLMRVATLADRNRSQAVGAAARFLPDTALDLLDSAASEFGSHRRPASPDRINGILVA